MMTWTAGSLTAFVGDPDAAPGSWVPLSSVLAAESLWLVNQQVAALSPNTN